MQIDKQTVKAFWEKAVSAGRLTGGRYSAQTVLKKFGLVDGDYLTNAGNVLFGNSHPVTLKAALFATDEKLTFLDMQMYEDNILNLLKAAETYILKNINWRSEIVGIDREEVPEIPVAAIREILANSYAHSVYNSNTYHEICIYPSRVTIYSPGPFASTYSPEDYINKDLQSSMQELAEATSKSLRTIQRTLDSLREKDLIERIGSDRSGYWEMKKK